MHPRERLVYTWVWADDPEWENHASVVTVVFIAKDTHNTELRLTHENLPSRDSRENHVGGWTSALDRFHAYWSENEGPPRAHSHDA